MLISMEHIMWLKKNQDQSTRWLFELCTRHSSSDTNFRTYWVKRTFKHEHLLSSSSAPMLSEYSTPTVFSRVSYEIIFVAFILRLQAPKMIGCRRLASLFCLVSGARKRITQCTQRCKLVRYSRVELIDRFPCKRTRNQWFIDDIWRALQNLSENLEKDSWVGKLT